MSTAPTPSPSSEARRVFHGYVEAQHAGRGEDFQELCARHPELAQELRTLRERWLRELMVERSGAPVSVRIGAAVGRDVDVQVTLDRPELDRQASPPPEPVPAQRIGRYDCRSEVARGGQGAILKVYDQDLRRTLAMKVVLGEEEQGEGGGPVASVAPKILGRFLEEAQVTAQLDHPGIVPVHELGLDARNRVYFTMKLVRGEDLGVVFEKTQSGEDGWSRTRALNVLVKVCEAMSYAHHKRVIHRDLKPANVMVGRFGEVYVMDWGLARVLDETGARAGRVSAGPQTDDELLDPLEESSESALLTMDGDIVGTLFYMPPEQAVGKIEEMGPQSDVYSVGAMLYELLAGHRPFVPPGSQLGVMDLLLKVQNERPEPLAERAPDAPLELVAICEKAMARDPAERYADMSGLAEDLRAFLEGRVVQAYETGAFAELRKWIARNKPLAGAMVAGVLALVLGLLATLVQKTRADRNAELALEREGLAHAAEIKANREAETARQTANFLTDLFEVVDPGEARGNTITAREILDRGSRRIDVELGDQPIVQSSLMTTMGTVYESLGLYEEAQELLARALERRSELYGPDDLLVAETLNDLGTVKRRAAEYDEAEGLLRRALELRRSQLGRESEATAESMHELGVVLTEMGRFAEAEPLFREALEVRQSLLGEHPDVASTLDSLAFNLYDQGDGESPEALLREALALREKLLGSHPDTAESLNNLGVYLFERKHFEPGEELLERALEMKRAIYTSVHPEVALSLNNLAVALHDRNELDRAEPLYEEALSIQRQLLGEAHPDIAQAMNNIAILRQNRGDWDGAKEAFLESLAMYRRIHGDGHPSAQLPLSNTIQFLQLLVERRSEEHGETSPEVAEELTLLADLLLQAKRSGEAIDAALRALEILSETPSSRGKIGRVESLRGAALLGQGELEEAEGALLGAFEILEQARGRDDPETQATARRLIELYARSGQPEEADRYRAILRPEDGGAE